MSLFSWRSSIGLVTLHDCEATPIALMQSSWSWTKIVHFGHALFFLCLVSRHFFFTKPTRAHGKSKMSKEKKRTGSVFQTTWPTNDAPSSLCWAQSFFFSLIFLFPNNDKVKQLPVATVRKFDFFPGSFLRGQRTFLTLFNRSTSRTHSSSRPEIVR